MRDRAILSVFARQGLRSNELHHLDVGDIRFDAGTLWVRKAKGSKQRLLPLDSKVANHLGRWLARRPLSTTTKALFITREGTRISNRTLREMVKARGLEAGLKKDLHPHSLRHSFAVNLLEHGATLEEVRDLMGHSNVSITDIYTHVSAQRLRKAQDRLGDE